MSTEVEAAPTPSSINTSTFAFVGGSKQPQLGLRVNGKQWHAPKKAFRPTAGFTKYEKRKADDEAKKATKAIEQQMKDEKEGERQRRVQSIIDKRKAKEERERFEKMAEKTHRKIVERRKKREKRNNLLASGK